MSDLLIQVAGVDEPELQTLLNQALPPESFGKLNRVSHFSGKELLEIALKLQHVDLNGLALIVGYLLGRGHTLKVIFQGINIDNLDFKKFRALLDQVKNAIKQQDLR
jgi:hypothetical protein